MPKLQGFISYAHKDARACELLLAHLAAEETRQHITFWTDAEIRAGKAWRGDIAAAIANAHVILMLISAFFEASDFIRDEELPAIRKREAAGDCLVVPIQVRHCRLPIGIRDAQAIPTMREQGLLPITNRKWGGQHKACFTAHNQLLRSMGDKFPGRWV